MLSVYADIINALDGSSLVLLSFLDLFAAFDNMDHCIIRQRLARSFENRGSSHRTHSYCFQWLESYLTDHTQSVLLTASQPPLARSCMKCLRVPCWGHYCSRSSLRTLVSSSKHRIFYITVMRITQFVKFNFLNVILTETIRLCAMTYRG